jgi:hypothetical protein
MRQHGKWRRLSGMRWLELLAVLVSACGGTVVVDVATGGGTVSSTTLTSQTSYDGGTCGCSAPEVCVHACCGSDNPPPYCAVLDPQSALDLECVPSGDCYGVCMCVH